MLVSLYTLLIAFCMRDTILGFRLTCEPLTQRLRDSETQRLRDSETQTLRLRDSETQRLRLVEIRQESAEYKKEKICRE